MPSRVTGACRLCYFLFMGARVLVTEADEHLGYGLVENLLARGYEVNAGVRHAGDERRAAPLRILGAKVVDLDVDRPDKLAPAMTGMDGLFHTQSVRATQPRGIEGASGTTPVEGMLNVLAAARNAGVKRIVFTSRTSTTNRLEERAWEFTRANDMEMVAIRPSAVLGPGFRRHSPCTETIERILREQLPALPPLNTSYVDVRDVAELQRRAFERRDVTGTYVAVGAYAPIQEVARMIQEMEPSIHVPLRLLPK